MEIALEKLPVEERLALFCQLWDSIASDDSDVLPLTHAEKVMLTERLSRLRTMSNRPATHRLGALPELTVPDGFDDIEVADFD